MVIKQNECMKCKKRLNHIKVLEMVLKGERDRRIRAEDALTKIISKTNHCAHDSDEASMMIHEACTIAKELLDK